MRRVLLRGPLDLVRRSNGDAIRAEVVTDGLVPCDPDDEIRPFARFRRSTDAETASFVAIGDRTLTERPQTWVDASWRHLSRMSLAHVSDLAFNSYEYSRQGADSDVHLATGKRVFSFSTVTVKAVAGEPIEGLGYAVDMRSDEIVASTVARMRVDAADGILMKGDAVFVSKHLPRWHLKNEFRTPLNFVLELADYTPRPEERSFRMDRREAGVALMQAAVADVRRVDGEILDWDAVAAPPLQDDLVRLAAMRAPETTGWTGMSVDRMPSGLVHAWHDVRNAARIVADGGRPAAERILGQTLQMLDHRRSLDGETWSLLRDRLSLEGIAAPGVAPSATGPRP